MCTCDCLFCRVSLYVSVCVRLGACVFVGTCLGALVS